MKPQSKRRLKLRRKKFLAMKSIDDLAHLTSFAKFKINLVAGLPFYHIFTIPKKNGKLRIIENPSRKLKKVQRTLNNFLQAVYFYDKTDAAYGFIIRARDDKKPRNIISNANQHLDAKWLMNMDLTDFFHYVKIEDVYQIFTKSPFLFPHKLANKLAELTTFKGRLPMGAPTSPVLSNFASIKMDNEIAAFAKSKKWHFTRYADDMSFSMEHPPAESDIESIRQIAIDNGFLFNETKLKIFGPNDEKIVTGLKLGDKVTLSSEFTKLLKTEIFRLQNVYEARAIAGKPPSKWVKKYEQQVQGRLAFAKKVLGEFDPKFIELEHAFERAIDPPDEFSAVNWLDFPYH